MNDKIIKCLAYNGKISVICANTTELVEKARKIHDLSPVTTAAFGRLLTITALMGNEMKNEKDKLTIQMKGNGPIGMMVTVANNFPVVKGYVANPVIDLPLNEDGKLDVGGAVGHSGFINVIKDIGMKEPYIGVSTITSGEIAEDFAEYFAKSEQKNTAVALGVLVDKNGVKSAGGYMITPMPDATDEEISQIEQSIFKAGAISRMLDEKLSLLEIAKKGEGKKAHIGYYLIDNGLETLYENLKCKYRKTRSSKVKVQQFISLIIILTVLLSTLITVIFNCEMIRENVEISMTTRIILNVVLVILLLIPCSEIVTQIVQFILNEVVKPKLIPKMDYQNGIPEEKATMVVIPTIVKTSEKVKELMKKLEVFYIANKSENLYFTLLGDCSESSKEKEDFDKGVIEEGKKQIEILNKKYHLDSQGIFEYMKEILDIKLGKENRAKIWKRIDGEDSHRESTRYIRCLIVNINGKEYLVDRDQRIIREFQREEEKDKRGPFIPYSALSRGDYDYYNGK